MAAPIPNKVQTPDDSGNLGKKIRTQSRVIGSDTVNEPVYIHPRQANVLGVYRLALAQVAIVQTVQNGTTTGALWFQMPVAQTNTKARLRRLYVTSQHTSAATLVATAARVSCYRMTFTGTPSGTQLTPIKVDASGAASVADLRSTVTGLTPVLQGNMGTAGMVGLMSIVTLSSFTPYEIDIIDPASQEDEWPVFAPGEGFVVYQDVAGSSTDTRVYNVGLMWDEISVG